MEYSSSCRCNIFENVIVKDVKHIFLYGVKKKKIKKNHEYYFSQQIYVNFDRCNNTNVIWPNVITGRKIFFGLNNSMIKQIGMNF